MEKFSVQRPFLRIILGPMKAEKSTSAIRISRKFSHFCSVLLVNSAVDTRDEDEFIKTHAGEGAKCIKVHALAELEDRDDFKDAQIVIIDEAQFFPDLTKHVTVWCDRKSYVVASLDGDAKQEKFGQVWELIPYCDYIEKLHALCEVCKDGTPAVCTIHIGEFNKQVSIDNMDGKSKYVAVCRQHRTYTGK